MIQKLFLFISILLLIPAAAFAEDLNAYKFCFTAEQAQRLVVELEGSSITNEMYEQCTNLNTINETIIADYKEIEIKLNEQIAADAKTIKDMEELINEEREVCNERVDAMKPGFKEKGGWFLSGAGTGSILTLLVLLLL
ncbi:MAG: hypothetical protein KAS32_07055 [Candidatus Peribacteraceae bacterium]|nr:hypothetical protein [Candidatus Peribacteraceae bacterium]